MILRTLDSVRVENDATDGKEVSIQLRLSTTEMSDPLTLNHVLFFSISAALSSLPILIVNPLS